MADAGNNLPVTGAHGALGLGACQLQWHFDCDDAECEIQHYYALYTNLTAGQIRIGIVTAVCGLLVSSGFALGVLAIWMYHAFYGHAMPAIPWVITSIASAPFAAGVITTLGLPKKARLRLEGK